MYEFLVILLLVLVNGVLAGAEMAVVTARKVRLEALAAEGSVRARAVLRLRDDPERFLAAVQVGITLVGALAGAFGGSAFADRLAPVLAALGLGAAAHDVAFALVVALVTYLSVVFGELVPKSLALGAGDRYALVVAQPMLVLSWVARPVVWLLTASSNLVLRGFGDRTNFLEGKLTREDLELMVRDAQTEGTLDAPTGHLVTRAMEFTELRVADVMVHRREIVAVQRGASPDELRAVLLGSGHRRVPVVDGTIDRVTGYVMRDDVLTALWTGRPVDVTALTRSPFFLSELTSAERALRELQQRKLHLAIVVDENGGVAGIVTLEDLVEELVGEIFHELDRAEPERIVRESPGTWLVHGGVDLRDIARSLGVDLTDEGAARTIGGLCVTLAEDHIPPPGAAFELPRDVRLEVVEASARRVRLVRLRVGSTPGAR